MTAASLRETARLAANKGIWGALGIGDFYYELGVQLIQVSSKPTQSQFTDSPTIPSPTDGLAGSRASRGRGAPALPNRRACPAYTLERKRGEAMPLPSPGAPRARAEGDEWVGGG